LNMSRRLTGSRDEPGIFKVSIGKEGHARHVQSGSTVWREV
jgi:hypothetical protein